MNVGFGFNGLCVEILGPIISEASEFCCGIALLIVGVNTIVAAKFAP